MCQSAPAAPQAPLHVAATAVSGDCLRHADSTGGALGGTPALGHGASCACSWHQPQAPTTMLGMGRHTHAHCSAAAAAAAMNEVTWKHVADWEALHCDTCPYPTLLRFRGRPDDLRWVWCWCAVRVFNTAALCGLQRRTMFRETGRGCCAHNTSSATGLQVLRQRHTSHILPVF